jgi:hypothetical protein
MSEKLFSLFRNDNGKALIENVPMSEISKRQSAYSNRGGGASLTVVPAGQEFSKPKYARAVTVVDGEPQETEVQVVQAALPGTDVADVVMGKKASVEAANWILENGPKAGLDFSWSSVIDRAKKGKDCTVAEIEYLVKTVQQIKSEIALKKALG